MRRSNILIIIAMVGLILIVITGAICYGVHYLEKQNIGEGNYVNQYSLAEEAAANAAIWLSDAKEGEADVAALKEKMGALNVNIELQLVKTGLKEGNYTQSVDMESYEECRARVYEVLEEELTAIISERLKRAGFEEAEDSSFVKEQIEGALSMSAAEYIAESGVKFMPDYEELLEEFSQQGTYTVEDDKIVWSSAEKTEAQQYMRDEDTLIITAGESEREYPLVYEKVK